ncbi:MAG: SpoIIIAC/SpoIIIAD family protein [Eubacteriales bacterium]|nr:SpoIIIAC/SpoIIIAD family protein [Eubacteriales bacterium]
MIELFKIIGIGILTLIAYLIIKPLKPEVAVFISIVGSVIVIMSCIDGLMQVINTMTSFVEKTGINTGLFGCILKIIGVGYVIEFASGICSNAGNSGLADAITLAGKITILVISLPIINSLITIIMEILP